MGPDPKLKGRKNSDEEALLRLVELWVGNRPVEPMKWLTIQEWVESYTPVAVPQDLLETITSQEPDRSQVITDASMWLTDSQPLGLGLEYFLEPCEVTSDSGGRKVVTPLCFRLTWATSMNAMDAAYSVDTQTLQWERVVQESDTWKVGAIWSPAQRVDYRLKNT